MRFLPFSRPDYTRRLHNNMKGITNDQILRLMDYNWKNIPKLIEDSGKKYNLRPHHYTMQRIVMELLQEGKVVSLELPFGTKKTKVYKLRDL
jgi:hypothetical protein